MIALAFGMSVLTGALYVAGYFALSETMPGLTPGSHYRVFPSKWLTTNYKPAAHFKSASLGNRLTLAATRTPPHVPFRHPRCAVDDCVPMPLLLFLKSLRSREDRRMKTIQFLCTGNDHRIVKGQRSRSRCHHRCDLPA